MKKLFITALISISAMVMMSSCASKKNKESAAATTPATQEATTADTTKAADTTKEDATKEKMTSKGKVTCSHGNEVRTIEVAPAEGKACEVIYTKAGEAKSVASAITDNSFCESVSQKISKHLEDAGYKCE